MWAVKQKIASILRASADQLMLVIGDRPSAPGREQRPLCQVGVVNKQTWLVKSSSSAATVSGAGVQLSEVGKNKTKQSSSNSSMKLARKKTSKTK